MTTLTAPTRSMAQRLDALELANSIRSRRAQLKRDIKAGRVSVDDVLADPPDWAASMKVIDLLLTVPKLGRVKTGTVLNRAAVAPSKTLGGISSRQRWALLSLLHGRGWL